jgi:hypothetical protein
MFYERDDVQYAGKLLGIIPLTDNHKKNINQSFMKVQEGSGFIYEIIEDKIIR